MGQIAIYDADSAETLTLDKLIEELLKVRRSGHATGAEKVAIGYRFMAESITAKSVAMIRDTGGTLVIGISAESELQWQKELDDDYLPTPE